MTNTEADTTYQIIIKTGEAMSTLTSVTESVTTSYGNGSANLLDTLGGLRLVELAVDQARRAVVARARAEGYTWQEMGDTLGTTRQAAHERFSEKIGA